MAATSPSTFAVARFLAAFLLGPFFGTLVFASFMAISDWQDDPWAMPSIFNDLLPMLGAGYMFGLLPAGLGGLAYALLARYEPRASRQLIGTVPLGAVAGALGIYLVVLFFNATDYLTPPFYLIAAAAGAFALLVSAALFIWLAQPRLLAAR